MPVSDEEVLIFLINRYVMIDGQYYRDLKPEMQAVLFMARFGTSERVGGVSK